jgi:hypothetical protein
VAERAAWDAAVGYYEKVVSPVGFGAREQYLVRMQLAGFDGELKDDDARRYAGIVQAFRSAVRPAYAACRWPAQDAKNRRFIADLAPHLAAHEGAIAPRLERLYATTWPRLPIPVDVVETVDWSGANSSIDPAHLLVATATQGNTSLEVVFHEASHVLMGRGAPVQQALAAAAREAHVALPGDLWHVVLFFTTGEVVRRIVDDGAGAPYTPMLEEIFGRSSWKEYRGALEKEWGPYVEGQRTLADAAAGLVSAVKPSEPTRPRAGTSP